MRTASRSCEAQEVPIENNLFIHNSPVALGYAALKGGLRHITFRANTVVGHPAVKWTGAFAAVCLQIDQNPPIGDLTFENNIWCDPTGGMPRFSISDANVFRSRQQAGDANNIYWNGGKTIPTGRRIFSCPIAIKEALRRSAAWRSW